MAEKERVEGLGGWLIVVALGIVFSPLRIAFELFPLYSDVFRDGYWELLTTPGTEAYHVMWAPIILGELGINLILMVVWVFIGFLFFTKNRMLPKWYIGILLFTLVFIFVDAFAVKIVVPNEPIFNGTTIGEIIRTLIPCIIWIPYMLVSQRVKATFVR